MNVNQWGFLDVPAFGRLKFSMTQKEIAKCARWGTRASSKTKI